MGTTTLIITIFCVVLISTNSKYFSTYGNVQQNKTGGNNSSETFQFDIILLNNDENSTLYDYSNPSNAENYYTTDKTISNLISSSTSPAEARETTELNFAEVSARETVTKKQELLSIDPNNSSLEHGLLYNSAKTGLNEFENNLSRNATIHPNAAKNTGPNARTININNNVNSRKIAIDANITVISNDTQLDSSKPTRNTNIEDEACHNVHCAELYHISSAIVIGEDVKPWGSNATFECFVSTPADANINVTWIRQDIMKWNKPVQDSPQNVLQVERFEASGIRNETIGIKSTLELANITRSATGFYTCSVRVENYCCTQNDSRQFLAYAPSHYMADVTIVVAICVVEIILILVLHNVSKKLQTRYDESDMIPLQDIHYTPIKISIDRLDVDDDDKEFSKSFSKA